MSNTWTFVFVVLVLAVAVAARVLAAGMAGTKSRKFRFGMVAGLFFLYTMGLFMVLYSVYDEMLGKDFEMAEYHEMVTIAILGYNTAVFIMGCISYVRNGKHRLSDAEKMKLLDM